MSVFHERVAFSLVDVGDIARNILSTYPAPIPAYRLLNEVLRLPTDDPELRKAREAAVLSKWIHRLEIAQLPDGSWGRFHSQDTRVKTAFRTTEEAIDRAFSLGLDPSHPVLAQAKTYIENVLNGQAHVTDREEKSESWPLLINFILAGRLAQIEPANPLLDDAWDCLVEITRQAFISGKYQLADEAQAFLQRANTHVPKGFLESKHALLILSARTLPGSIERQLVEWIWHKPDGIRYLRAPLYAPQPRMIAYWLRSMNILTRFPSWREVSVSTLNRLWDQRDNQGLWDFGSQIAWCTDFPLSESWRQSMNRRVDYSTCILVLLRRYSD